MSRKRSKDSERKTRQAWETINRLLDKWYGKHIEEIVRTAKRPELRPKLKQLFFELTYYQHLIEKAQNLDEMEAVLERNAENLDGRVKSLQKRLERAAEERKAAIKEEFVSLRKKYEQLNKEWDEHREDVLLGDADPESRKMDSLAVEAERIFRDTEGTLYSAFRTSEHLEDILLGIDRKMLTKELVRFRRRRKVRRVFRKVGYFFWGVVILGVVFNLIQSFITGALGTSLWLVIITLVASYLSQYVFDPWLSRRNLETQRKHLVKSLKEFYQANIQITVLAPMKEERIMRVKARRSRSRQR